MVEYANLMDEIAKELGKDKENIITIGNKNMPGCLLWMDDVVLIHHDKHIMQNMIDTTNEIVNRYRIQFGQEKSKIMIVGKDKDRGCASHSPEASQTQLGRVKSICDLAQLASGIIVVISVFNSLLINVFLFVYGTAHAHGVLLRHAYVV